MAPTYIVYNRRQQGLAETTRLILEISGADYQNKFVQVKIWRIRIGSILRSF